MKKIISLFIVLITVLTCFSACSNTSKDIITAEDGIKYIVARDENKNIIINDNNKLQVYSLNENGKKQKNDNDEYIIKFIDFNGQVVIGQTVETAEMTYKLPKGFKNDFNNPGYFFNEHYSAEIFFSYYPNDIKDAIIAAEKNSESLLESFGSEVFEYKKYTLDVNGYECTAFRQRCTSSEFFKNAYIYYIPYDNGYYMVNCNVSTENENKYNFDKFIETVRFK